ncbi:hypothetical protein Avbf_16685 [Armadillidium vulgare]|nr:hypothetical protein Avbf_16685 [Armadillidium vulgare]
MDIKCEIKMKDEPLENTQDNALIVWNSEQERNSSPNSGVKNEFGIEDESLEIEMKEPSFEQLSEVDETRRLKSFDSETCLCLEKEKEFIQIYYMIYEFVNSSGEHPSTDTYCLYLFCLCDLSSIAHKYFFTPSSLGEECVPDAPAQCTALGSD